MILKFTSLILAFIFISCGRNETRENTEGNIKINFKENKLIYEDIFENTLFIPLETNTSCLITKIDQMRLFDNKIFILDFNLNSLLVFNMDGKFLNKIGNVGRGPGEYIRPRYFYINNEGTVKLFDAPMKKLISFDTEGRYIKEIKLNRYLTGIGETRSEYWGYCADKKNDRINSEQQKKLKFFIFDSEGKEKKHILGNKNIDNVNLSNTYILNDLGESVSFVEPFTPDIYSLKNGEVSVKYKIDYSGFFPSERILSAIENMKAPVNKNGMQLLNTITYDYASFFVHFFENEKWIVLFTPFKTRTIVYNKVKKRLTESSNIFWSDKERKPYFYPCCLDGDNLICSAGFEDIKRELEINDQVSFERKKKLESLLSKMKNKDNPVIFICAMNK
ncbi:MAG: 6-bladed beta-propeller [Prolixibacteraceae bacterium]